jgi:hypothetical protein
VRRKPVKVLNVDDPLGKLSDDGQVARRDLPARATDH